MRGSLIHIRLKENNPDSFVKCELTFADVILLILQDNPAEWVKELEKERIEAYNGATQLDLVRPKFYKESDLSDTADTSSNFPHLKPLGSNNEYKVNQSLLEKSSSFGSINHNNVDLYPHKAKFLMDHVLYLPVHKRVPVKDLEYLCQGVLKVAQRRNSGFSKQKDLLIDEFKTLSKL